MSFSFIFRFVIAKGLQADKLLLYGIPFCTKDVLLAAYAITNTTLKH
jgi:hypothetical protein